MRMGNARQVTQWLERAAQNQRTFYGLIATRALGRNFDFHWDVPEFTPEKQALLNRKRGRTARTGAGSDWPDEFGGAGAQPCRSSIRAGA